MAATSGLSQSKDSWITPQEQLEILASPLVSKQLHEHERDLESIPEIVIEQIAASAIKASLKPIIGGELQSGKKLFDMVVEQHLAQPRQLPSNLTNWYTALQRIDALPEKIPPLPLNIHEILGDKCPIDPSRKIGETHSLYLIPPGSLNELEERVRAYGQEFFQGENPLKFRSFWGDARQEHAGVVADEPQWILITNDVLPGSRNQPYAKQEQIITDLNAKNGTDYQVPTLRETVLAMFLHKITTHVSLYPEGNEQNGNLYTYTRVVEKIRDWHLVVGGFAPSGLSVNDHDDYDNETLGVAALRKF